MIRFLLGLIFGAAAGATAGAVAGLLLAPKTGEETRQIVAARATQATQKARRYVDNLRQYIGTEQAARSAEKDSDNHVDVTGS